MNVDEFFHHCKLKECARVGKFYCATMSLNILMSENPESLKPENAKAQNIWNSE